MIFYSEDIIKGLKTQEQIDDFHADVEMIFTYFAYPKISLDYIYALLKCKTNRVAFYCMDDIFDIRNCPSCMIYSLGTIADCSYNDYYILLICTHRRFKSMGYATMLLDGFIESVKHSDTITSFRISDAQRRPPVSLNENWCNKEGTKIILSSVDEAVSYYQSRGFVAVDDSLKNYPELMRFEKFEKDKMYTIMEFTI
jgi:hypothetical protein